MLMEAKRQLRLNGWVWLVGMAVVLGVWLFVLGTLVLVARLAPEEEGIVAVGPLVICAAGAMFGGIATMATVSIKLNLALKMGATRREYLLALLVLHTGFTFLLLLAGTLVRPLDSRAILAVGGDLSLSFTLPVWMLACLALGATVAGLWGGGLILRYGRRGFWVLWALFMGSTLVGHQVQTFIEARGFGGFGQGPDGMVALLQSGAWAPVVLALAAVLGLHSYLLLRRVQATG